MVKKFISAVLVVLALILFGGIASATQAQAATSITSSVDVAKAAPTFVTKSATPATSVHPSNIIGGGVIKPFWRYVSCYLAMDGYTWCWRYACTTAEYWLQGCRDGWYRVPKLWYV